MLPDEPYHRYLDETADRVKDVFLYLLVGLGLLSCMLLVTCMFTIVVDWVSNRLGAPATAVPTTTLADHHESASMAEAAMLAAIEEAGRSIEDYDRGPIARQANLWGLLITERELILQKIFHTMSFPYNANEISTPMDTVVPYDVDDNLPIVTGPVDIEMANITPTGQAASTDTTGDSPTELPVDENIARVTEGNVESHHNNNDASETGGCLNPEDGNDGHTNTMMVLPDDADHYRLCSICLTPYEDGVRVMTGVQCQHMFHEQCCQQWLLKHDHCPYCRKNMLLSTDFRTAAIQTLGNDRIAALSVIVVPQTRRRQQQQQQQQQQPNRIIVLN